MQYSLALIALFSLTPVARADVSFSFPLNGYYRPGRYMPVQVTSHNSRPTSVTIAGAGIMPTEVSVSNTTTTTIPLLMIRPTGSISWSSQAEGEHALSNPLHALAEEECLIGYAGGDADALKVFFPDKKLIGVALDLAQPLPGSAATWESLDGIVLDAPAAARLTQLQLDRLLATGMAVAIRSPVKPAGQWPWKQSGTYWTMRFPIAGPLSAFAPAGYSPVSTWSRGWPIGFRREVVLASLIFVILALGATLWRSRWNVVLLFAISVSFTAGVFAWRARQPVSLETGGTILISNSMGTQQDRWTYRAAMRSAKQTIEWETLSHPIFATRGQIEQISIRLICDQNGEPQAFEISMEPSRSLALLDRSISPQTASLKPSLPVTSPLRSLAQDVYEMQGIVIAGQISDNTDPSQWPSVCINSIAR